MSTVVMSFSRAQTMDCGRKHWYAYHEGLRRRAHEVPLRIGAAFDAFLTEW